MGWMHELPRSADVHIRLNELGASAADMAQHLVQPTAPSHHSHIHVLITLGGLGMVTG
jgi:hypothetical protein